MCYLMPGGCTPESSTALLFGVSVGLVAELGYAWLLVDIFVWSGWVKKIDVLDKLGWRNSANDSEFGLPIWSESAWGLVNLWFKESEAQKGSCLHQMDIVRMIFSFRVLIVYINRSTSCQLHLRISRLVAEFATVPNVSKDSPISVFLARRSVMRLKKCGFRLGNFSPLDT